MTTIQTLRSLAEVTQTELASATGTSQPAVAAYESGSKSPTLSTVERLTSSVGKEAVVIFVTPLTREDRRSLAIHQTIVLKLRHDPTPVLGIARANLKRLVKQHPHARRLLNEWDDILNRPVEGIIEATRPIRPRSRTAPHATVRRCAVSSGTILGMSPLRRAGELFVNKEEFDHGIRAAGSVLGINEVLVIGSRAVPGSISGELPPEALRSIEVDIAAFENPDGSKADLLANAIGEASMFQATSGFYVDGVSGPCAPHCVVTYNTELMPNRAAPQTMLRKLADSPNV